MLNLTRRNALTAVCAGAAFGLPKPVSFIEAALAQKGHRSFDAGVRKQIRHWSARAVAQGGVRWEAS